MLPGGPWDLTHQQMTEHRHRGTRHQAEEGGAVECAEGASDGGGEPGSPAGTWTFGRVDPEGRPFSSHILHGTLWGSAPPRPLATWQGFFPL